MKPETATSLAISLLLGGSLLCLGARHAADRKHALIPAPAVSPASSAGTLAQPSRNPAHDRRSGRELTADTIAKKLRSLLALGNPADRTRALLELCDSFSAEDWPLAMDALKSTKGAYAEHRLALMAWAEKDAAAAMSWVEKRGESTGTVIFIWGNTDPDALLSYLFSPDRPVAPGSWGAEYARSIEALANDLPHLAELIARLPEKNRRMVLEQARPDLGKVPPDKKREWIESLDPELRRQVLAMILRSLPGVEERFALAQEFHDDMDPKAYLPIYSEWTRSDPAAAVAGLDELGPGPLRRWAVYGAVTGFSSGGKMREAVELTRRYPDEADDQLLQEMMNWVSEKDAPLLAGEITRVENPDRRTYLYKIVLGTWLQADEAAAKRWMRENEIPEQVRRELENKR